MKKKIYKIIVHVLIFIAYSFFMPGLSVSYAAFGRILAGLGYAFVYTSVPTVLRFFKLPNTIFLNIIAGIVLISGYFFLIASQIVSLIKISSSYIGSTDLILVNIPKLITLDSQPLFIIASAILLLLCSIMMDKLKK